MQLPGLKQRRGWCGRFVEGSEQGLVVALMEQGLLPATEQFLGAGVGRHHHEGGGLNPHQVSGGLNAGLDRGLGELVHPGRAGLIDRFDL